MIVLFSFVIGVIGGVLRARSRGGNRMDMAQYGAIYGMIFAIFGVFLTIFLGKML